MRTALAAIGLVLAAVTAQAQEETVTIRAGRLLDGLGNWRENVIVRVTGFAHRGRRRRPPRAARRPAPSPTTCRGSP